MAWLLLLLLGFADSFWEIKAPADWTLAELQTMLSDSPWAQISEGKGRMQGQPMQIYIATAAPMVLAELEREKRSKRASQKGAEDLMADEYRVWLEDNRATQIIVAVRLSKNAAFSDAKELKRMETECVMHAGKKKFKITGYFPPSTGDPHLRLAFPRQVELSDKTLMFELFFPGVPNGFREVQFSLKDMVVKGKLEL
jgi:hypothetical protein